MLNTPALNATATDNPVNTRIVVSPSVVAAFPFSGSAARLPNDFRNSSS
jgi:hypothetical protein